MAKTIDAYRHMTPAQFIAEMERKELCPREFKLKELDCIGEGELEEECRSCWAEAIKDISFNTELVTFEKEHIMALTHLAQVEQQFKNLETERKDLKSKLLKSMEEYGVNKFDNDLFSITYVKPGEVETFDRAAFKKDYPELYDKYTKKSKRAASVLFKLR